MKWIDCVVSPVSIAFAIIIFGYYFGKIKIGGVSFGLAGVLITAVIMGCIFSSCKWLSNMLNTSEFRVSMGIYSSLGTALFVSVIGLTAGYLLDVRKNKAIKSMLVGSLMVVSAVAFMKIITFIDTKVSYSKLVGALCGALTTTPGLSAVNELAHVVADEATLGYGCTYLFGVIAIVLYVQIKTRRTQGVYQNKTQDVVMNPVALGGLIQIGIIVFVGRLIGSVDFFGFSLGDAGGILCTGIVLGVIVQRYLPQKIASVKTLEAFRQLGLVLFFVGNGVPAGMSFQNGFEIRIVVYGIMMTIIPIMVGEILCRAINRECSAEMIAGGMTSTPAIGILVQKCVPVQLSGYSMAYVGALLTIIVLVRIL